MQLEIKWIRYNWKNNESTGGVTMRGKKILAAVFGLVLAAGILAGCGDTEPEPSSGGASEAAVIQVSGDGMETTEVDLSKISGDSQTYIYSIINNWPSKKFYAAEGVDILDVLKAAGAPDTYRSITFRGSDGYEGTFTREQLENQRYYYPNLEMDSESGAEPVPVIISTHFAEDSSDPADMQDMRPTLIFGQETVYEHNSPSFVEDIAEIILSDEDPGCWEAPTIFPEAGTIAAGETVKLQHPSAGIMKIYYTTDGSDPTESSTMYNPSTYQPELNAPIPVNESMTIRAFAAGYGKRPSEIAEFHFDVQ